MATSKRLEKPEPKNTKTKGTRVAKKKTKEKGIAISPLILIVILLLIVLGCGGIGMMAANSNVIYDHVKVMDIDLSGCTYEEAIARWNDLGEEAVNTQYITLTEDGKEVSRFSLSELGVSMTTELAVDTAWNQCHGGNFFQNGYWYAYSLCQTLAEKLEAKYESIDGFAARFTDLSLLIDMDIDDNTLKTTVDKFCEVQNCTYIDGTYELMEDGPDGPGLYFTKPKDGRKINADQLYHDIRQVIDDGVLQEVECKYTPVKAKQLDLKAIYKELHADCVEATYDRATSTITESSVGVDFDVNELKKEMDKAEDGVLYKTSAQVTYPKISTKKLEASLFRDVIGTYTTKVSGSSARLSNVQLAAKNINGFIMNPGEQFWYNNAVGKRTEERGFKAAPAYVAGKTVDEVGGGICQVSSTLYYATLLADMKIVLRYAHQFAPSYIPFGCDATVSWGGPDFAFENNTEYPIKIVTSYNDNNLTVSLYGTKVSDRYVEILNYVHSRTDYEVEYEENPELEYGEELVVQTPYTGYYVTTTRNIYEADGTLVSSEFEAKSNYDSRNKIIQRNSGYYVPMMPVYADDI